MEVRVDLWLELSNDDLLCPFASGHFPIFVWIVWGPPWEVGAVGYFAIMLVNDDL